MNQKKINISTRQSQRLKNKKPINYRLSRPYRRKQEFKILYYCGRCSHFNEKNECNCKSDDEYSTTKTISKTLGSKDSNIFYDTDDYTIDDDESLIDELMEDYKYQPHSSEHSGEVVSA
ncbi:MAG TPA: hypothetical protein VIY08_06015 [Candidatus Nitrosocosmicus sp.]